MTSSHQGGTPPRRNQRGSRRQSAKGSTKAVAFGNPGLEPPPGRAYEWNQALFDLGREVCIARRPRCELCPLAGECPSRGRTYAPLRRQSRFEGSFRQRRAELLRAIAAAGSLPDAEADAEALVSLVRDGLAEVAGGYARLPA